MVTNLLLFVFEEAHWLLPLAEEQNRNAGDPSIFTLVVRMREYGLAWISLLQMISRIAHCVLANSFAKITFIVTDGADIKTVKEAFSLNDKQAEMIGKLPERNIIVKLSGKYLEPFISVVPEIRINKNADEKKIQSLMTNVLSKMQYKPRVNKPVVEKYSGSSKIDSDSQSKEELTEDESKLLFKIVSCFWLPITEQYESANMSLDKGDSVKNSLCKKGFIIPHRIHTGVGGYKVICEPTDKAYQHFKIKKIYSTGGASFEHQYFLNRIADFLRKFGNVKIEHYYKSYSAQPDIIFRCKTSNGTDFICTIEVELNKTRYDETHIIKNIKFSNYIIIACKTKIVQTEVNKIIADFDDEYKAKLSSCLLSNFEKHFMSIYKKE